MAGLMLSILYTVIEFVIVIALGFVFLFLGFLLTGLDKDNFQTRMPNLLTEICTFADLAHPLIHQGKWAEKLVKKSVWLLFIVYYLIQVVLGTASYWAQRGLMLSYSTSLTEAGLCNQILCHQVIAFFVTVFLELLTNDTWTKQTGFAKAFTQWCLTWVIYLPFQYHMYYQDTHSILPNGNFFIGGSMATSLILTNLLWTNIYSVLPWDQYKPFTGNNRCGNYLGLIFIIAAIKYAICYGFAILFDVQYANQKYEGTWTILCYTWLSFALIGVHIAEPLWNSIDKCFKQKAVTSVIVYTILCSIIAIGITAALYFIFTRLYEDIVIEKGLNIPGSDRYATPGYWWAFSIANVYYTYWMMQNVNKHVQEEEKHEQQEQVEEHQGETIEKQEAVEPAVEMQATVDTPKEL